MKLTAVVMGLTTLCAGLMEVEATGRGKKSRNGVEKSKRRNTGVERTTFKRFEHFAGDQPSTTTSSSVESDSDTAFEKRKRSSKRTVKKKKNRNGRRVQRRSSTVKKPLCRLEGGRFICTTGKRKPNVPGGKQSVGYTFHRSWLQRVNQERKKHRKSMKNGPTSMRATEGVVKKAIGAGWWLYTFGAGKSTSATSFSFNSNGPVILSMVDLFCRGDSFAVYDNDRLIGQSSRVKADKECVDGKMIDPQVALEDGRWSSVVLQLTEGRHSITVKAVDSPWEGGTAAIRFDTVDEEEGEDDEDEEGEETENSQGTGEEEDEELDVDDDEEEVEEETEESTNNTEEDTETQEQSEESRERRRKPTTAPSTNSRTKVCRGYNGYVIILTPFPPETAGKACRSINTKLADISNASLYAAVKSVLTCVGPNRTAWVDAYNSDGEADLALTVGKDENGGALTQSSGHHPVVCQVIAKP